MVRYNNEEKLEKETILLQNAQERKEEILAMYERLAGARGGEEAVYRFYHHSFKTFYVQDYTEEAVQLLLSLIPDTSIRDVHPSFVEIYTQGTYKTFQKEMNARWLYETRPILECYFHVKHLLEMIIKYGVKGTPKEREGNPGWFTVLYFYNIR